LASKRLSINQNFDNKANCEVQNWNVLGNISDKRYSKLWRQSIESLRSASLERVSEKSQLDLGRTIETRLHKIAEFHNNSLEVRGMTISPQPRIQKGLGQKSMHSSFSSLQDALYPLKVHRDSSFTSQFFNIKN